MQVLEKILEEIEREAITNKEIGRKQCEGMARAMNIIRSNMDDCKTFEFDFVGVKSFDCPCGRRYVNTSSDDWIPVEERLPEQSLNSVIGWDEYRKRCVFVQFYNDRWIFGNDIEPVLITAWMPLPEPYKPEVNSDET